MQNDVESLYVFYLKFERNVFSHAFPLYSSGKICVKAFLTGNGANRRTAKEYAEVLSVPGSFSMNHTRQQRII